jgi:hypothetical protein
MVHFLFPCQVDVHEVARGFPQGVPDVDLRFQMPRLEDVANVVLGFAAL